MLIGINLLFLKQNIAGGTDTYSEYLLRAFAKIDDRDLKFIIFSSQLVDFPFLKNNPSFTIIKFRHIHKSVVYRIFFEQIIFPYKLRKYNISLLHSLGYAGPVFLKNHVVTIHDANTFVIKQMSVIKRLFLSYLIKLTAGNCSHIITVSNFSKDQIIFFLKVREDKVSVIYEASKFERTESLLPLPKQYKSVISRNYFVGLCSVTGNKNIETLLKAFEKHQHINSTVNLVLIGHMPGEKILQKQIQKNMAQHKIVVTGYIDNLQLKILLGNALCFIFPSTYEGFGLPIVEAQALGIPVLASKSGSLPEVGGGGAVYFDAGNCEELAQRMQEFSSSKEKRIEYSTLGYKNVERFSWIQTANETITIYKKFAHSNPLHT